MKKKYYKFITNISRLLGPWFFAVFSRIVALGYFFFFPNRVSVSRKFYKALFPGRKGLFHLWCVLRQYQNFTNIFLDGFILKNSGGITHTSEGLWSLTENLKKGSGGIILMSHLGNWEIAAYLLKRELEDTELLLYMGAKNKEQIENIQKSNLMQDNVRIIAVDKEGGSPFDLVEGIKFLKKGGLISMAGDRVWGDSQRVVNTRFLGHEIRLPESPYLFALLSGKPIFVFFSFRTGKAQYHFSISGPLTIEAPERSLRNEAIKRAAGVYAGLLEEAVRKSPFEWYHFESFLGPETDPEERDTSR